ncbi:putative N-acetyltransferase 8B [Gigaspora margarita]|uniref:Putative N-acetyltransferase 8B n=1 Tax=Gigaspora margarita TaxID=4874 RepID=A0A8H4EV05_GIGMA|nr:putative N-acetyltransferase 8B [Gigaspora margarita]
MAKISRKDGKKPYYSSNSLPEYIRIRKFQQKDCDEIQRIYANSMMDNVPYAISDIMQHRYLLCLWLGLTYFTVKNHSSIHLLFMLLVFCGWGFFLYVNVRRIITSSISYETRLAIHTDLAKISEKYGNNFVQQPTKFDKHYYSQENTVDTVDPFHNDRISKFWVAVDKDTGNKVVGFLEIVDDEDGDPLKKHYFIEPCAPHIKHLCVATNYKRQGIATALLNHAIKFIHKKNAKSLAVLTSAWQGPALEIFYRFGFIEVKRGTMAYGFVECIKLRLDVEQWIRCRKARKHRSSISDA